MKSQIAEKAIELAVKHDLATINAIIYTSALMNNSEFITLDNDFTNLPNVSLI